MEDGVSARLGEGSALQVIAAVHPPVQSSFSAPPAVLEVSAMVEPEYSLLNAVVFTGMLKLPVMPVALSASAPSMYRYTLPLVSAGEMVPVMDVAFAA